MLHCCRDNNKFMFTPDCEFYKKLAKATASSQLKDSLKYITCFKDSSEKQKLKQVFLEEGVNLNIGKYYPSDT